MLDTSSLSVRVERLLKEDIVTGAFVPGQKLDIDHLASRWGVSVTPVRDAVRRLEMAGFLRVAPRRGVYVSTPDHQKFKDVFDLRIALECLAITSATDRIPNAEIDLVLMRCEEAVAAFRASGDRTLLIAHDAIVHDLVLRHCGNQKLVDIMDGLSELIRWTRNVSTADPAMYAAAVPEHLIILEALRARDAKAAETAMRDHLRRSFLRTSVIWDGPGR